jgi:hypothetical protein
MAYVIIALALAIVIARCVHRYNEVRAFRRFAQGEDPDASHRTVR